MRGGLGCEGRWSRVGAADSLGKATTLELCGSRTSIIFNLTFEVKLGTARINVGRMGCGGMCLETACRRFEAAFVLR